MNLIEMKSLLEQVCGSLGKAVGSIALTAVALSGCDDGDSSHVKKMPIKPQDSGIIEPVALYSAPAIDIGAAENSEKPEDNDDMVELYAGPPIEEED